MNRKYDYYKDEEDRDVNISGMLKYANSKQEIDKFLEKIISSYISNKQLKVLDACCGIGHLVDHLSSISPESMFYGWDQTSYLIEKAKQLFQHKQNVNFEVIDIYDFPDKKKSSFDISISWKTLSWLPYYDEMIKSLMKLTKHHIFISSLFYDEDIDFEIKVREYKKESAKKQFNAYYNVYSLPRFKKFVYGLGAKNIQVYDFNIDIDISKPSTGLMGTYTAKLEDGTRMQISGAVVMYWKIIRIDL